MLPRQALSMVDILRGKKGPQACGFDTSNRTRTKMEKPPLVETRIHDLALQLRAQESAR
jgi:hypothetical protein